MRDVLALILSGGGGERLGVLCAERAVSALPFGGKYRVIDFVLSNCCHSGVSRVGVLAQHAPASLNDHIGAGRPWDLDRRSGGIVILQPYQTRSHAGWYRGTADAIAQNWDWIEEHAPDRVLVLSGDHVVRMDYRPLVAAHIQREAAVTVAVTKVPANEAHRFGMVHVERSGRIKSIEEKPQRTDAALANMGIYLFETDRLREMLKTRPVDVVLDILRPQVAAGHRVYAHEFNGYWEDVGTVASYYRANLELVRPHPRLVLHDARWPILTRDEERPPVWAGADAVIEDSLVANGCRVEGHVRRSILFPGVHVGPGAEISESVIMADTKVSANVRIEHAILDKYVKVGAGAVVGEGDGAASPELDWLAGLTLVGKDTWLPDGAHVHRPSAIGVGGRYEDLRDGVLEPGTVVPNRRWYEELR
ncbi:MAG: sugar phosphate nucleotidyltransferase [Candidatus Eisenbacteria bacterium]